MPPLIQARKHCLHHTLEVLALLLHHCLHQCTLGRVHVGHDAIDQLTVSMSVLAELCSLDLLHGRQYVSHALLWLWLQSAKVYGCSGCIWWCPFKLCLLLALSSRAPSVPVP